MRSRRYFTGGIRQLIAELKEAFDQANVDITISSPAGLPKFASAIGIWQATSELRRKIEVGEVISRARRDWSLRIALAGRSRAMKH
jgi:hypothetical protein